MTSLFTTLLLSFLACETFATYQFRPDDHGTWRNTRAPALIDLSEDQNNGSYWSSAFVTTTSRQQFLLVHHQFGSLCKSSVLDLSSLEYWRHHTVCEVNEATKTVSSDFLSIRFANFSFMSIAPDKISELKLSAQSSDYKFDLTVQGRSSKVLLNGGNGVIAWGPDYATCSHWSIPAARTSGTLVVGHNPPLTIIPSESFTWYDHQVVTDAPSNFTWFEVHFPSTRIRVSIWAYDWPQSSDSWRYATVRLGKETELVLPYTLRASETDIWVSSISNTSYPQTWTLEFENGDFLHLRSVRGDQEIKPGTWTGFVVAENSSFFGQTSGFGVGDVVNL